MEGNNDNHDEPLTSPIIMQTHAYFISPPAAGTADQNDVQQQSEEEETSDQQPQVLSMLAFEAEALSPAAAAGDDAAQGTLSENNSGVVPIIERSGTSATEGTEDYSNPSSPASAPSTPTTRGIKQLPAATPAGPAERTRRDDKLSMLYTPVKGNKDDANVSMEDGMDDFMENESVYEKRKCNWVVWAALVVFIGGALVITTGVVVHNKKQAAAAASLLHQTGGAIPNQPKEDAIVPAIDQPTPTSSPSAKVTEDASPPVELESFDQLDKEDLLGEDEAIGKETVDEPALIDDNKNEDIVTTNIATPEDNNAHDASSLPESTSSPTITSDEPTASPTIDPYADVAEAQETQSITEEMNIQEKKKPDQSDGQQAKEPAKEPATSVTITREKITYRPGDLTVSMNGLLLSGGLTAEMIAKSGKPVLYRDGKTSDSDFHLAPDFGGVFPLENGGWIYASNSEVDKGKGGVGAITFDNDGKVVDYKKLLKGTSMNCGGGKSPWGTWISCEELNNEGQVWEVDPTGKNKPKKTVLGGQGGRFESFSYDIRNKDYPRFFVTEDKFNGALRRFTPDPSEIDWDNPSKMLYGNGTMEFLVLLPDKSLNATKGQGTFTWTKHLKIGRESAMELFPNVEGIDVANGELFFVSKRFQEMTVLDLDTNKYRTTSTIRGLFDGKPDQIQRITDGNGLLFFTEEGGVDAGVHARDSEGRFYTILESPVWKAETTGLSFSPDNMHMYVAYQANGLLFDVTRTDGLPFDGRSINAKFHKMELIGNGNGAP